MTKAEAVAAYRAGTLRVRVNGMLRVPLDLQSHTPDGPIITVPVRGDAYGPRYVERRVCGEWRYRGAPATVEFIDTARNEALHRG